MSTSDDAPIDIEVGQQIRRLICRADYLDERGRHDEALSVKREAAALGAAELQRARAFADALTNIERLTSGLTYRWRATAPNIPYLTFIAENDDPEVKEYRERLGQETFRALILEGSRA